MANRFPLILDTADSNKIKELGNNREKLKDFKVFV